ncbi:hypothetical protein EWH70_05850 [Amycolatopsis suaedae]|uniref:YggT family protein n=1 Tax=Amycolatopsis suaedae TaxID=2510978 RepID=A0A4Q7JFU0_9PSEU|nr:hypothetical protein EWH70_05850 [Amycolatopsis suaedae]
MPRDEARPRRDWRATRLRVAGVVANVVRWIGLVFAAVLVLHVIFVVGGANSANSIVRFIRSWAETLSLGFTDLFVIQDDAKLQVLVNYGIAALFWLIVSAIVAKVIRRLGGSSY